MLFLKWVKWTECGVNKCRQFTSMRWNWNEKNAVSKHNFWRHCDVILLPGIFTSSCLSIRKSIFSYKHKNYYHKISLDANMFLICRWPYSLRQPSTPFHSSRIHFDRGTKRKIQWLRTLCRVCGSTRGSCRIFIFRRRFLSGQRHNFMQRMLFVSGFVHYGPGRSFQRTQHCRTQSWISTLQDSIRKLRSKLSSNTSCRYLVSISFTEYFVRLFFKNVVLFSFYT